MDAEWYERAFELVREAQGQKSRLSCCIRSPMATCALSGWSYRRQWWLAC